MPRDSPQPEESAENVEKNSGFDPLLEALIGIGEWHGERIVPDQALSGLPLQNGKLTPALLMRAAEKVGFRIRLVRRPLKNFPSALLPAILVLKGNRAGILHLEEGRDAEFWLATEESEDGWTKIPAKELKSTYTGFAFLLRPANYEKIRESAIDSMETGRVHPGWFWGTVWKFRGELLRLLPVSVLINLFAMAMPLYIMSVYDRVVPNDAEETLWVLAAGAVIVFTFEYGMRLLRGFLLNRTSKRLDSVLASALFDHLMAMEMGARPLQSGMLASKARAYEALRDFFTSATLVALVDVPFAILMLGVVFYLGGWVGWIPVFMTTAALLFGLAMQWPLRRAVTRAYRRGIERQSFLTETVSGLESIKSGNAQNAFQKKMENMIREASQREVRSHWYSLLGTSTTTWLIHMTTIFLVIGCVYRVYGGSMTLGGVVACVILTSRAMAPLAMVTGLMTRLQQMLSSLRGLNQIMALPREYGGGKEFTAKEGFHVRIEVNEVSFRYPGQSHDTLDSVSFRVSPGERVGIIGRVGSGKSTLLKLLAKLYEPESGEILYDGLELSQYHPVSLRRHVGYLPQSPDIFHGSLRDNVALGTPWVKDEKIYEALRLSGLEGFVNRNPLGMHVPVGEQGSSLSGGQRAAVALARCFLREPKLLLLDEPTASMDVGTEREVVGNLTRYLEADPERTLVLATHKIHLLDLVDRVILVEDGTIALDGEKDAVMSKLQSRAEPQSVARKKITIASGEIDGKEGPRVTRKPPKSREGARE